MMMVVAGGQIRQSLAGRRVIDLVGHTDLRTAAGVLAHCRAVVTNDSGAMHLAAAIGLPVTAVFGPTDERVTGPAGSHAVLTAPVFCRPCRLRARGGRTRSTAEIPPLAARTPPRSNRSSG